MSVFDNIGKFEVFDFHTHPFIERKNNICSHIDNCSMSPEGTVELMRELGVSRIAGSVIAGRSKDETLWEHTVFVNNQALKLRDMYGDFYVPGIHVHPAYVKESCDELERMHNAGVNLIGELVPYFMGWRDDGYTYESKEFDEILDVAEQFGMVVSFHSMDEDAMDNMVKKHPNITFVAAHPGEYGEFCRHMERMKFSENLYLDVSGYGIFRHGMLRHAIDEFGPERFIYGSDYPTCNPAMYLGGVLLDPTLKESEIELILAKNANRILGIK